jgi:glyoxylase-like metal-dependent hydrolase (beta-lactamase superfamily II)
MIFKPYYYFETGCAAYLFGCGELGKCAVVDAHEEDVDAYIAFAASKGMRITHVIDTHVHADHRSGGPALAKKAGAAYCLHESANVDLPFEPLRDSDAAPTRGSCSRGTRSLSAPWAVLIFQAGRARTLASCTTAFTRSS